MFNELIQLYYDYFTNPKNDGWRLLGSSVCIIVLLELYKKFLDKKEIVSIEELPTDKKQIYWDMAGRFYQNPTYRIKASKAAYVLELITSNE